MRDAGAARNKVASLTGTERPSRGVGIVRPPPPQGGGRTIPSASLTGWVGFRLPHGSLIYGRSLTREGRAAPASLTGKRSDFSRSPSRVPYIWDP